MAHSRTPASAIARASVLLLLASMVGCADLHNVMSLDPGGVDPSSPVAAKTVAASRSDAKYIPFEKVPVLPKDLRPASAYKTEVGDMVDRRRALERQTAGLPVAQTDTEGFARTNSDKLLKLGLTPPAPDQSDQTDAYVAKLRALAAAPRDGDASPAAPTNTSSTPPQASSPPRP